MSSRRCCARGCDIGLLTKDQAPELMVMLSLRGFAINAVVGLVILFVANAVGLGVQISLITLLVCGVFGVPGAILVILLAQLDIAFAAAVILALLV